MDTGLIHIYCGDGKGKTTAALGLTLRCLGRGGRIVFAQFLKGRETGELYALKAFSSVSVLRGKGLEKFTFQMTLQELEATKREQMHLFSRVAETCRLAPDMLVLDEIITACSLGLVPEQSLLSFLQAKPASTEIVMTGRNPSPQLIERADYVSEICKRKHPYDRGVPARIGIEE